MNWLDIVLVILVGVSILSAARKGFSREVIGVITAVIALLCGLYFYGSAGAFLRPYASSPGIANFCGFFLLFCGILLLGGIVGILMARLMKFAGLSWFDRLLGAAFGTVKGLLIATALVMAIVAFTPGDSPPQSVVDSRLAPYVIDASHVIASMAPRELKDGFRKHYDRVKSIWEDAMKREHAGVRTLRSDRNRT
jgi:membrane protein required for colicin V production